MSEPGMSETEEKQDRNDTQGDEETLFPSQAAARLGVTKGWIHRLIRDGRLPATRMDSPFGSPAGHYFVIRAKDLDAVRGLKRTGRPKQSEPQVGPDEVELI